MSIYGLPKHRALSFIRQSRISTNITAANSSILCLGGPNCIYALTTNGTLLSKLCLSKAQNYDWEAIATAPCDSKGKVYKESQMGAKTFATTSLEYKIFF